MTARFAVGCLGAKMSALCPPIEVVDQPEIASFIIDPERKARQQHCVAVAHGQHSGSWLRLA